MRRVAQPFVEFLRRYRADEPDEGLPIGSTLQPVVVVDDVRHLSAPSIVAVGWARTTGAAYGAGTYTTLAVEGPAIIRAVSGGGAATVWGLQRGTNPAGPAAGNIGLGLVGGEGRIGSDDQLAVNVWEGGAAAPNVYRMVLGLNADLMFIDGIYVGRREYCFLQNTVPNSGLGTGIGMLVQSVPVVERADRAEDT